MRNKIKKIHGNRYRPVECVTMKVATLPPNHTKKLTKGYSDTIS